MRTTIRFVKRNIYVWIWLFAITILMVMFNSCTKPVQQFNVMPYNLYYITKVDTTIFKSPICSYTASTGKSFSYIENDFIFGDSINKFKEGDSIVIYIIKK